MNAFQKLIYTIGGYDWEKIDSWEDRHYRITHIWYGLSLVVVLFTSFYGGWHFTETLLKSWKESSHYIFIHTGCTLIFSMFIVFIDCLVLNAGKHKAILWIRFGIIILLSGFIGILTTLNFCSDTITAELNRVSGNTVDDKMSVSTVKEERDKLQDIVDQRRLKINELDSIADREFNFGQNGRPAGGGRHWQEYKKNIEKLETEQKTDEETLASLKSKYSDTERETTASVSSLYALDFPGQVKLLWSAMKTDKSIGIVVIVAMVLLIFFDSTPLFFKISRDYPSRNRQKDRHGRSYDDPTEYEVNYNPYKSHISKMKTVIEERIDRAIKSEGNLRTEYEKTLIELINNLFTETVPTNREKLDLMIEEYKTNKDMTFTTLLNLFIQHFMRHGKQVKDKNSILDKFNKLSNEMKNLSQETNWWVAGISGIAFGGAILVIRFAIIKVEVPFLDQIWTSLIAGVITQIIFNIASRRKLN